MTRKIFLLLTLFALLISLISCVEDEPVYGYAEIRIDLNGTFSEHNSDGIYDAAYSDGRIVVGILRLSFAACEADGIPATVSPRIFSGYYRQRALDGVDVSETVTDGDVVYFTYRQSSVLGDDYTYLATFFKTPYAYFVITYVMPSEEFERNGFSEVIEYAHTTRIVLD